MLEQTTASVTLIAPNGATLTARNATRFRQSVLDLIEQGHSRIVIDLHEVSDVDSTGIGALVSLLKRIGLRGEMVLCGLCDKVARMFQLTRMDMIFPIQPDSAAALRVMAA